MPPPHPDAIADCVVQAFKALPSKFKPRKLADGRREWVPLAGIVLSKNRDGVNGAAATNCNGNSNEGQDLTCAALATGMKCLPQNKVGLANGNVLHDSHAEVLAIRAFNRFLVDECAELAKRGFGARSQWVRWRERSRANIERDALGQDTREGQQPFELQDGVGIHMYCSECPCGDASMELTMADQADATPWTDSNTTTSDLLGRGHFDQLGVVRRKPARADAPPTLSKSCSDKLALKQVTGLLSSAVGRLVWPGTAYLSTLLLPENQVVPTAAERAWGRTGRMRPISEIDNGTAERWRQAGYSFRPFSVHGTSRTFEYSKPFSDLSDEDKAVSSNLSAVSTPYGSEILINGVLQGRQQFDPRGASCVSRRRMWEAVLHTATLATDSAKGSADEKIPRRTEELAREISEGTYADVKLRSGVRREIKQRTQEMALKGWKKNEGDDGWRLNDATSHQ